nr:MAG TPA: hypothetical protein [Caudoviricetes sp.]
MVNLSQLPDFSSRCLAFISAFSCFELKKFFRNLYFHLTFRLP